MPRAAQNIKWLLLSDLPDLACPLVQLTTRQPSVTLRTLMQIDFSAAVGGPSESSALSEIFVAEFQTAAGLRKESI
jgi:hypothetical protein